MRAWASQPVPWGIYVFTVLLIGIAVAIGVRVGVEVAIDAHDAKTAATRQQEGRAVAVDVLCGFSNGVADAGRRALAGQLQGQRGPGLPIEAQQDYVTTVNRRVIDQAGVRAADVLIGSGPNAGLIDCRRLRLTAKATHP
jgi:hypothetical protein